MEPIPAPINSWIDEHHQGVRYGLEGRVLVEEKSKHRRITIIDSKRYGKGLLLDGCWMTAEYQEKHYHECLVQPALCSAEAIRNILVIGGGDGGTAKECLRHNEIEHLDMVEIDKRVVQLSQEYLPTIGGSAWKDPRFNLIINDGISWAAKSLESTYDVVIVDGSDPSGPAKGLFNKEFLSQCRRILRPGGVFSMQSQSPESFRQVHIDTVRLIREVFDYADPLYGSVPMYPSGWWSWTFASTEKPHYRNTISKRAKVIEKDCEIWSTRWQRGAFEAIPASVERELSK